MPSVKRAPKSKDISDGANVLLNAMNFEPYPVVTPGYKDPFSCFFGTSKKSFSVAPRACTEAEADSDIEAMRVPLPELPLKAGEDVQTANALEFVTAALPAGVKELKVILKIPVSENKITKRLPPPKTLKETNVLRAATLAKGFMKPTPVPAPTPKNLNIRGPSPTVRRSTRAKISPKGLC